MLRMKRWSVEVLSTLSREVRVGLEGVRGDGTRAGFSTTSTGGALSSGVHEADRRGRSPLRLGAVTETQPLVIYDGVCNFCNASVNFLLQRDQESVFKFTHWQHPFAQ